VVWIDPATAVKGAALIGEIAKRSAYLKRLAKRIHFRISKGALVLPIFGAGGAGKTTAASILAGSNPLDIGMSYRPSTLVEQTDLTGDIPGQILAAPGQDDRADRNWPALFRMIASENVRGFINVVSYGYHSFSGLTSYKEHKVFKKGMPLSTFRLAYLEHRRLEELKMLDKLVAGLSSASKPLWMVTLVNKQDLWWDEASKVRSYYLDGDYGETVRNLSNAIGNRSFQHEFIPASLTIGNLSSPAGELISKVCEGYDIPTHMKYLNSFFYEVYNLVKAPK
jgi:hypothetical protein